MSRSGIGSASIMLVFAVLCLVIFTVISIVPALNDEALIESEVRLVKAFYAADTVAEQIIAEILVSEKRPEKIAGVEITIQADEDSEVVSFMCEISETKGLYVKILLNEKSCEILSWRMVNKADWQVDERINVWQGYNHDEPI
ncbi:MAG: hypothetical protein FWF79_05605 [Defluviitaleaceae bacterium]|nr:hypothetical protein [Defluviitaleaceae bacterium]